MSSRVPSGSLQQYLPFTVLKRCKDLYIEKAIKLQQYLPFTVLKLAPVATATAITIVATVLTVYGIETNV